MCTAPQEQDFISKMAPKSIKNWGLHVMVKFPDMNPEYIFSLKVRYSLKGKTKQHWKTWEQTVHYQKGQNPQHGRSHLSTWKMLHWHLISLNDNLAQPMNWEILYSVVRETWGIHSDQSVLWFSISKRRHSFEKEKSIKASRSLQGARNMLVPAFSFVLCNYCFYRI